MTTAKKATAGKKVAAKKAAVSAAKATGSARRQGRATAPTVSTAKAWKAKGAEGYELEVPSGNVALVRPVGMQAFLDRGMIPNSLREIAMEAIKGKKKMDLKVEDLDEEQITNMISLFDSVTVYCVIKPEVETVPLWTSEDAEDGNCSADAVGLPVPMRQRDPDLLYVDEVDLPDKMFIFQFACGGTRSVEQFREEYARSMERVLGEQNVEEDAE